MSNLAQQKLGSAAQKNYVGKVAAAIAAAITMWQLQAKFVNVKINGPVAVSPPGSLQGPTLEAQIKSLSPQGSDWERKMSAAIAAGVSNAWKNWQQSVFVPGLPWYPTFAAFPGPMAPPTPNIPTPIATLGQNAGSLSSGSIKNAIVAKAAGVANAAVIADAVATGVATAFVTWQTATMVKNVMGQGPVPSFAPPYVPVGPVVLGDTVPVPGAFL
jgi:hypothetical protein